MENTEGDGEGKRQQTPSEKASAYESNMCKWRVRKRRKQRGKRARESQRSSENLKGSLTPFVQDVF